MIEVVLAAINVSPQNLSVTPSGCLLRTSYLVSAQKETQ